MKYNVTDAQYLSDYKLMIQFEDGTKGEVDLESYTKRAGVFSSFSDLNYFKNFIIEYGTVVWGNEVDIAPERLYERALLSHS